MTIRLICLGMFILVMYVVIYGLLRAARRGREDE